MKRKRLSLVLSVCLIAACVFAAGLSASAASVATNQSVRITAVGRYSNWDGVTNVAQFKGADGSLCYAVASDDVVTVYRTSNGTPVSSGITLQKPHPLFGTVVCDSAGYYYLVTGEANGTDDTDVETVFISKFDSRGNHIRTVGDNGSSSLAYYYGTDYYTKHPFDAGTCDAAISGDILTVHYARKMYSGHQSNSVFSVNTGDMSKVSVGNFYESHSFAQRVVPTADGFVYMSEGDCYDRAFCVYRARMSGGSLASSSEANIFDFWVEDGAFDAQNMRVVNNNFAHMGGIAALPDGKIAFAAQSAPSLSAAAATEGEEVFLQIFDPDGALNSPSGYVTTGERSGLAGNNGRTEVTDYGVKWLTSYGSGATVSNVQIAAGEQGEIVVLYELTRGSSYDGVWYVTLDGSGNVTRSATRFDANARLNPCETPVYSDGSVWWVGNRSDDSSNRIYIWQLPLQGGQAEPEALTASRVTLNWTTKTYNGAAQRPTVTVKNAAGATLAKDTDYTAAYAADSKAPGTYTVTVTGKGNYTGSVSKTYTITKQPVSASRVTLSWTGKAYNGAVQKPAVTVKNAAGYAMTENASYTVSYSSGNSKFPGTYSVTVTGKGYYSGSASKTYTITRQPVSASRVTLSWTGKAYNGAVQKPTVTVKNAAGYAMTENASYTVSYSSGNSKFPGTYSVTVTGKGYYSGSATKTYTLTRQPLSASRVTLSWTSRQYNGAVQQPTVTVKDSTGAWTLTEGSHYTVSYAEDSKYPGSYTVTVTGRNNFSGTVKKTYTIAKQQLDASRVTLSATGYTYDGKVHKPTVTVKNAAGYTMTLNSSYTVTYPAGCTAKGTYTVTVTGKGYYTGVVTKTFTIR